MEGTDEQYQKNSGFETGRFIDTTTARIGEEFVNKKLCEQFGCDRVNWLNSAGEAGNPYDFIIYTDNSQKKILYFIDAKSTSTSEYASDSIPFFIMNSEWDFIAQGNSNYLVARVFDTRSFTPKVKYLKVIGIKDLIEIDIRT